MPFGTTGLLFYFQTRPEDIQRYVDLAGYAIAPGGVLALGTFSESSPMKCSGLPITRYSEDAMTALLQRNFRKIRCDDEDHPTPFGTVQNFTFCALERL